MSPKLYTRTGNSASTKPQFTTLNTHWNTNTALERGRVAAKQLSSYTKHHFTSFMACGILDFLGLCSNSQDLPLKANFRGKKRGLFDWLQSSSKLDDTVHIKQQSSFHSNTHSVLSYFQGICQWLCSCTQLQGGKAAHSPVNSPVILQLYLDYCQSAPCQGRQQQTALPN